MVLTTAIAFVSGFALQWLFIAWREIQHRHKLGTLVCTHAGAVVYKVEQDVLYYLIITLNSQGWIEWGLPHGHVECGEGHIETALRELEEEASVVARMVRPLGVVQFRKNSEDVRVKYYLMQWLFDLPGTRQEKREVQWLPFEEALAKISFHESQRMLIQAHERQSGR